MVTRPILLIAFENVAGHITNLKTVKSWVDEMLAERKNLEECIRILRERAENEDVTMVTDIRILINEVEHESRIRSMG